MKSFNVIDYGIFGIINKAINDKSEILILGSSTAQSHYDPETISGQTKLRSFNAGIGGYGILLNYAVLNERIKKNAPDIVILDIAPNVIADPKKYDKLSALSPYYNKYNSFREILDLEKNNYTTLFSIKSLEYNSVLYAIARSKVKSQKIDNKGFYPLNKTITEPFENVMELSNYCGDSIQILYFKKIIKLCNAKMIKLFVLISPEYKPYDPDKKIINVYAKICKNENIIFFDFSENEEFTNNASFFSDQIHLNKYGADCYSKIVANLLRTTYCQ